MSLEQLVRPFARPDALSRRRIVASNLKIEVTPAIISWGAAGSIAGAQEIEAIDEGGTAFTVLSCDDRYEEVDRGERAARVENPDDPNQYVMVNRPTYIAFNKASEWEAANYTKTTTWQTAIETAEFSTININNKKCRATYELKVEIPA